MLLFEIQVADDGCSRVNYKEFLYLQKVKSDTAGLGHAHIYTSPSPNSLYRFQYSSYRVLYVNTEINVMIKAMTQHNTASWRQKSDYYHQNPLLTCLRLLQSALLSNLRMIERPNFGGNWASWFMVSGVQTHELVYIRINNYFFQTDMFWTETFLEWTNILLDELTFAVWYSVWHIRLRQYCRHFPLANAFSWMEVYKFRIKLYWRLSLWVNWQKYSIGSDNGLAPSRRQAIIWTNGG